MGLFFGPNSMIPSKYNGLLQALITGPLNEVSYLKLYYFSWKNIFIIAFG